MGGSAPTTDAQTELDATTRSLDAADSSRDASDALDASDAGLFPRTCADVLRATPTATDGDYTLYIDRDPSKPWVAFCLNMAGTSDGALPAEYLSFAVTGTGYNDAQYVAGGAAVGTTVTTTFAKVRLDPITLTINGSDRTFAATTGFLEHDGDPAQPVAWMPYGTVEGCDNTNSLAYGHIDLTGTPFVIDPAHPICVNSFATPGSFTESVDGKTATLVGAGYCGWTSVACTVGAPNYTVAAPGVDDYRTVLAYGPLSGPDAAD